MEIESALQNLIDQTAGGDRARQLKLFAARLFARLSPELAERLGPDRLLAIAASAFDFFSLRIEPIAVRVAAGSGGKTATIVQIAMSDRAFIVDSVLEYFHQLGAPLRMLLHPILAVTRDAGGRLVSFEQNLAAERRESMIYAELESAELESPGETAPQIAAELRSRLDELVMVTEDFEPMTARALAICEQTAAVRELVEARELLRWMVNGGFVFLGYRAYRVAASPAASSDGRPALEIEPGSGLGILRIESRSRFARPKPLAEIDPRERKLLIDGPALIIGKTHALSRVHRAVAMDDITIRRASEKSVAFDRFVGLFTSKARADEAAHVPVLRAKLLEVLAAERALPGSHDFKQIVAAFNSFPKEELFRASVAELRSQLGHILDLKTETQVRLKLYPDPDRRSVVALVMMPRERFSARVRIEIQEALKRALGGPLVYYHLAIGESYAAQLHFCFSAPPPAPDLAEKLGEEVARLARTWEDRLREQLAARFGEPRGREIAARWEQAFGPDYTATTDAARAAGDIERIEAMLAGGAAEVELGRRADVQDKDSDSGELRIYELGKAPALSELMPILQNFGIRVLSEDAHELRPSIGGEQKPASVQSFRVQSVKGAPLDKLPGASLLAEALRAVRMGLAEDDRLNALTLEAGLAWREVALVRAWMAVAFQMRLAPARPALSRVLLLNPALARMLVDLFIARFDPDRDSSAPRLAELRAGYLNALAAVENIEDDRVARRLLSLVEATVRTNYFVPAPTPDPYIALKFESGKIAELPDDPPLYEIHVNSPRMEGCHLRAGRVARGGIRFSDRADDYRTEILGLMKTQTVKNAIIVPVGSKGGFIVKARAAAPVTRQDVVDAYQTLMNAMLDLTDNVVGGRVFHPERVKVLDGDGPYLVVAADKGTAAFSDLANAIATRRGFWLGDAFASGGEHGYDHKALGITARGAWESARRHLREMGRDPERGAPIVMAGIGDMSGDVFGNGLLQSSNLKLIAAFDHRHIFIDPNPDPAASFAERKRMFALPASSWADYNAGLISPGGGVFRRGAKSIALSPEAAAALQCEPGALDSENLIRAILRAPVDLLYNGGIGTFVRGSDESDAQAGDHANDACRIAAVELRAKVVVEGGNLGFTQKARIEYAIAGGRINTDAIDNSAGVDMSDHEVNLKILLQPALACGALSFTDRNAALAAAAGEVAAHVIRDNRDQNLMLSLEQVRSRIQVSAFRDHLTEIEQRGILRRHEEALPTREALTARRSRFPGLTRPELSVLTAYTKIDLAHRLEATPLVDDPYLVGRFLTPYFPASIAGRFAAEIPAHGLRRELIATSMVNELVDLMGSIFVFSLVRDYGVEAEQAVRAWLAANDILDIRQRVARLKADANELSVEAELGAFLALERAVDRASRWALGDPNRGASIGETVNALSPALERLSAEFETMLVAGERERFERAYRDLRAAVHQEQPAYELARLAFADHLLNVLSLSLELKLDPARVAAIYFRLGEFIDFDLLETAADAIGGGAAGSDDRWERRAARELGADLRATRVKLTRAILTGHGEVADAGETVRRALGTRENAFQEVQRLAADLKALATPGLAALQVAARALTRLT